MRTILVTSLVLLFSLSGNQVVSQSGLCAEVGANVSAAWANSGGDKVTRDDIRATGNPSAVLNGVWDGSKISVFGARNEVIEFNLVLEAATATATSVVVTFDTLTGPGGATISSQPATSATLFDWTARNIELFYVRYLQIKGLSDLSYIAYYDERHVPERMRRPWTGNGVGSGTWADRPDHDRFYPDIAVPLELHPTFNIAAGNNQSIWVDIYIPDDATPGTYTGTISVTEGGSPSLQIPLELVVRNFTLPDEPSAATMLFMSYGNTNRRYFGSTSLSGQDLIDANAVRDRHFMVAHRHKISLIGGNESATAMPAHWIPRVDGSLFTAANGYDGPGVGVGNGIYSIGTYGGWQWSWDETSEADMHSRADDWVNWFNTNAPDTDYFLYLTDEPGGAGYAEVEQWSQWLDNNTGGGRELPGFCTVSYRSTVSSMPSLDRPCSWPGFGPPEEQTAYNTVKSDPTKSTCLYNGRRPQTGSFATEDDGVALRALAWTQYKVGTDRWFFWESTYYDNYQGGTGETNLFQQAHTFGSNTGFAEPEGEGGWNYSNGDGVLFYPGTDKVFPAESYDISGPIASLRLKYWRRGIQDVDYLTIATAIDPTAVQGIVQQVIPKVLWEYEVADLSDPTYGFTDISWSTDPDDWLAVRAALADIIDSRPCDLDWNCDGIVSFSDLHDTANGGIYQDWRLYDAYHDHPVYGPYVEGGYYHKAHCGQPGNLDWNGDGTVEYGDLYAGTPSESNLDTFYTQYWVYVNYPGYYAYYYPDSGCE